jgi:hypothetical protein
MNRCFVIFCYTFLGLYVNAQSSASKQRAVQVLKAAVLKEAAEAMKQEPVTVIASRSPRSAGSKHEFFSEGDYWWPNPLSADSPYVQRDGLTNPDNFVAHRKAVIRFSQISGALASAYTLTQNSKYVRQLMKHCRAWFADTATRMEPHLLYAQAIKGRFTGRGIGIIDAIQFMEVAQAIRVVQNTPGADPVVVRASVKWFASYLNWVTTHKYGIDEMNAENNHGTCWVMQVACFARLTGNDSLLRVCSERYKNILLPKQMAADGSFPRETARTKPYGYSLFNLDAMVMICQILAKDKLFTYRTADGKSIGQGIAFMYPFMANKSKWPFQKDVMYWDDWPVAQPALIFGANAFENAAWFDLWSRLDHSPQVEEVIRNLPVRHPLIWFE